MKKCLLISSLCAGALAPASALACPFCHTPTGVAIHAGIFDGPFLATALATAAPFPVLLGLVAGWHFGWLPAIWRRGRGQRQRDAVSPTDKKPGNPHEQ